MSDELRRWTGPVDAGRFRFRRVPDPFCVTVTHRILRPSPDGPVETGHTVTRYVDGVEVGADHV